MKSNTTEFKDLIPLSDYITVHGKMYKDNVIPLDLCAKKCFDYARFLKQPLTLSMFIPCDQNEKPLEKPKAYLNYLSYNKGVLKENHLEVYKQCKQYQKALDNVIFEGFELKSWEVLFYKDQFHVRIVNNKFQLHEHGKSTYKVISTIEDLTHVNIKAKY